MQMALDLARRGEGHVEPNPLVGCVLVREGQLVGRGWHRAFGGPHAEIEALTSAAEGARGATAYVNLEPCAHHGKTPPCADALVSAGVAAVVVADEDPFPQVAGRGIARLARAGIAVHTGVLRDQARWVNAPYLKRLATGRPWVIAKWAMSLDGKIATRTGESQWISNSASRAVVHQLRGRVDAIIVGGATARRDDPQLTARPPGARTAMRVVVTRHADVGLDSQLVRTAREVPTLIATTSAAPVEQLRALEQTGCAIWHSTPTATRPHVDQLLEELGRREMTNVLVEGGGELLGTLHDAGQIDEVHVFIAPRLIGGASAATALGAEGVDRLSQSLGLEGVTVEPCGGDIHVCGRTRPAPSRAS